MQKYRSAKFGLLIIAVLGLIYIVNNSCVVKQKKVNKVSGVYDVASSIKVTDTYKLDVDKIVYDGLTLKELGEKLDKNLNSTLNGYGLVFAKMSIKYEVDPYVATSIVLLETGCKWNCSKLVRNCNNIGGMKGKNKCSGSSYAKFETLDEGIEAFFKNLSNNYYKKGLTTPKEMNKKYAENPEWYITVENYVKQIKSS